MTSNPKILLDSCGYLCLTDFSFAKIIDDHTWTLCGTPEYLAPGSKYSSTSGCNCSSGCIFNISSHLPLRSLRSSLSAVYQSTMLSAPFVFPFSSTRNRTASPGGMSSIDRCTTGFDFMSSAASSLLPHSEHHRPQLI